MNQQELAQLRIFEAELKAALLYKNWTLVEGCIEWLRIALDRAERELSQEASVIEVEFAGGPVGETMSEIPEEHRGFNGYIFVDNRVEVGKRAVMDGRGTVYVHGLNTIFATVSSHTNTTKWAVMRNRLTGLDTNTAPTPDDGSENDQSKPTGRESNDGT